MFRTTLPPHPEELMIGTVDENSVGKKRRSQGDRDGRPNWQGTACARHWLDSSSAASVSALALSGRVTNCSGSSLPDCGTTFQAPCLGTGMSILAVHWTSPESGMAEHRREPGCIIGAGTIRGLREIAAGMPKSHRTLPPTGHVGQKREARRSAGRWLVCTRGA
jgi:hypothetical protein